MSCTTHTPNFWAQIILDPSRRPLTLTFLLVSTRGLFQDMMFGRLRDSTFSEDASEVLVQPLPCGTEKANSVARVVVKHTPRLCNRCASNTKFTQEAQALGYLVVSLTFLLAKKILAPRWYSNLPNTLDWRYALHAVSGVSHHSIQCFSHPSVQIFQCGNQLLPDLRERLWPHLTFHPTYCVKDYDNGGV